MPNDSQLEGGTSYFYCTVFIYVQGRTVKYGFGKLQWRSLTILAKWLNGGGWGRVEDCL